MKTPSVEFKGYRGANTNIPSTLNLFDRKANNFDNFIQITLGTGHFIVMDHDETVRLRDELNKIIDRHYGENLG